MILNQRIQRRKVSFHLGFDSLNGNEDILPKKTDVAHSNIEKTICSFRWKQTNLYI